jgi:hypothetical protein
MLTAAASNIGHPAYHHHQGLAQKGNNAEIHESSITKALN